MSYLIDTYATYGGAIQLMVALAGVLTGLWIGSGRRPLGRLEYCAHVATVFAGVGLASVATAHAITRHTATAETIAGLEVATMFAAGTWIGVAGARRALDGYGSAVNGLFAFTPILNVWLHLKPGLSAKGKSTQPIKFAIITAYAVIAVGIGVWGFTMADDLLKQAYGS